MRVSSYTSMYNKIKYQNMFGSQNLKQNSKTKNNVLEIGTLSTTNKKVIKKNDEFPKKADGSDDINYNNIDSRYYEKEDLKTGYSWIDEIKLTRDTTGPLSKVELRELNRIKLTLASEQYAIDTRHERGNGPKYRVDVNKYFDSDGYVLTGFVKENVPKMKRREELNTKINDMLTENGIKVSDKDELKFTVNVYNEVKVTGNLPDEKLKAIEKVLNDNKMGNRLVATTSGIAYKVQKYTKIENDKYSLNKELQRYTDIDLRDFEYNGKTLISKIDGRNIKDVYNEAIDKSETVPDVSKGYVKSNFSNTLKRVMDYGYEAIKDVETSIGFVGNKLYDIDAVAGYGVGQTDWYDNMYKYRGNVEMYNKYAQEHFQQLDKYDGLNQFITLIK